MAETETIHVNFGHAMPVFPLERVTLMPHAVLPVHFFEPRYRAMVKDVLDGPGQIAMAVFAGDASVWKADYEGEPRIRPAVCVGQIVQHHKMPDGRFNVLLQGVCRARLLKELTAEERGTMYRQAVFEPVGVETAEDLLANERSKLASMFTATRLKELRESETVLKHLEDEDVPTSAILELLTFSFLPDPELRYQLLAEPQVVKRCRVIRHELQSLQRLLERASRQRRPELPKGVSEN